MYGVRGRSEKVVKGVWLLASALSHPINTIRPCILEAISGLRSFEDMAPKSIGVENTDLAGSAG